MNRILLIILILYFGKTTIYGKHIKIPVQYNTIQEGINHAEEGDSVLVGNGIYKEQIKLQGKNICLLSESGAKQTIIDGSFLTEQDSASLLYIFMGEDTRTKIDGFTFRYGKGTYINEYRQRQGGAIHCSGSSFTLINCISIDNTGYEGGAVFYENSISHIENCEFRSDTAGYGGGAIYAIFSNISIDNTQFLNDHAASFGGSFMGKFSELHCTNTIMYKCSAINGGAIHSDFIDLNFCTIIDNIAEYGAGGGILCDNGIIQNSILYFNNSEINNNQIYPESSSLVVEYCDIMDGWDGIGNIEKDPSFPNLSGEDFSLASNSPCIDAANPECQWDPDGTRADMGAEYYNQQQNSSVFPLVLEFREINIGSSQIKDLTIYNIFDSPLTVSKIEITSDVFSTEITVPLSLSVGESINLNVSFTPVEAQNYNDSLKITTNHYTKNIILNGNGVTGYSGAVNGIWKKSDSPIILNDDVIVPANDTLKIENGVTIKIKDRKKVTINGILYAMGEHGDSVYFTNYGRIGNWWGLQFIDSPNESLLEYCVIEGANSDDNTAENQNPEENGGGIYCVNSNLIINNSNISHNRTAPVWSFGGGCGGGIYSKDSHLTVDSCQVSNNVMSHGGGGVYSINSDLFLNNSIIKNNYSEYYAIYGNSAGAGLYIENGQAEIINNQILYNYNHGYRNPGGGITVYGCENYLLKNNLIANNSADIGGGLFTYNSFGNIDNNILRSNIALDGGGGIYIHSSGAIIQKNIVENNRVYVEGGGILINSDDVHLINNTIAFNVAECDDYSGSGGVLIYDNRKNNDIQNCIIYNNKSNSNLDLKGQIAITYSLIGEDKDGLGNLNADPLFLDSLLLDDNSPCIDKGNPSEIFNDIEDPINAGFPLYPSKGSLRNDMGAYGGRIINDTLIISIDGNNETEQPVKIDLNQNYPNPFNPITIIRYSLPVADHIELSVYNILGQKVSTLVNKKQLAGTYNVEFKAANLASGVYIYKLKTDTFEKSRKMILLR